MADARKFLVIGDSITAEPYSHDLGFGWVRFLNLFCKPYGLSFSPWGVGGSWFVSWHTATDAILALGPTDVIVELGFNDFNNSNPLATVRTQAATLFDWLATHGMRVWPCTVTPGGLTGGNETNRLQHNADLLADYYANAPASRLLDLATAIADPASPADMLARYQSDDAIHPNARGACEMARAVYPRIVVQATSGADRDDGFNPVA